jgi:calcineurin-like phosphoesterase family protein
MKITSTENIAFTSDYHLWHKNIITLSKRPFADLLEMHEAIRDRHNATCDKDTIVFNLGDAIVYPPRFALRSDQNNFDQKLISLLKTFKGKIYYIEGNHEDDMHIIKSVWSVLPPLIDLYVGRGDSKQHIVLCHYAFRTWNKAHRGSWHLFGHSHGGLKLDDGTLLADSPRGCCLDVGVDTNNFYPYTYQEVKKIMDTKVFVASDHHSGRNPT